MKRPGAALILAWLLVRPAGVAWAQQTAPIDGWDPAAAAAYLDRRMDLWFAHGEKLRTGDGWATCVSCHTVVPYALARPAIRRTMRVEAPTPQESRLVDETSRRVRTFDTHQLLYSFDDGKKGESQGTEAVLYALILAAADSAVERREPSEATRLAFARLWKTQRADGAWEWLDVGIEPFESMDSEYVGAAFAAVAAGMMPPHQADEDEGRGLEKLRTYLRTRYPGQNLHHRVWGLLASSFLGSVLTAADRDALVAELERRQHEDGGWSLDGLGDWRWDRPAGPFSSPGPRDQGLVGQPDGYATGLIDCALRRAGNTEDHALVNAGLQWLRTNQRPVRVGPEQHRAWRAHSLNFNRELGGPKGEPWRRLFMSDAATAFAVLALTNGP
jgi:squalene-hopene/tetraprenyl-beta-curcumene cyclase